MQKAQEAASKNNLKFSNYLELLISGDVDAPISALARKFHPAREAELTQRLEGADQRKIAMRLLDALADLLADADAADTLKEAVSSLEKSRYDLNPMFHSVNQEKKSTTMTWGDMGSRKVK